MRAISISVCRLRKEMAIFTLCFASLVILNIVAIIQYKTQFQEVFTQLPLVALLALLSYFFLAALRVLYWLLKGLLRNLRAKSR